MNRRRTYKENKAYEVDLLVLARDIWDKKIVFALSLATCMVIAYLYTQVATPVYQASTSLFFDLSGKNREFGENYELLGDEVMVMQRKKKHGNLRSLCAKPGLTWKWAIKAIRANVCKKQISLGLRMY